MHGLQRDGNPRALNVTNTGRLMTMEASVTAVVAPVVSTSPPYTVGDNVGGKLTFTNAMTENLGKGVILSVNLIDRSAQTPDLLIVFFDSDPTGTTFTDNGATVLTTADDVRNIGSVVIKAADWKIIGAGATAVGAVCKGDLWISLKSVQNQNFYAAIFAQSTPTFGTTTALQLRVGLLQT